MNTCFQHSYSSKIYEQTYLANYIRQHTNAILFLPSKYSRRYLVNCPKIKITFITFDPKQLDSSYQKTSKDSNISVPIRISDLTYKQDPIQNAYEKTMYL